MSSPNLTIFSLPETSISGSAPLSDNPECLYSSRPSHNQHRPYQREEPGRTTHHANSRSLYDESSPTIEHDYHLLDFKLDFASKGLTDIREFSPKRRSEWCQGGKVLRVLEGMAKTNRKRLQDWEMSGVEKRQADTSTLAGKNNTSNGDEDETVDVYYQVFIGPDPAAIQSFHHDRAQFHDLFTAGFPYLQSYLAFLDDTHYSGLWTITEVPRRPLRTEANGLDQPTSVTHEAKSNGLLFPSGPTDQDTIPAQGSAERPMPLNTYWRKHVLPLRKDDLTKFAAKGVRFRLSKTLPGQEDKSKGVEKHLNEGATTPTTSDRTDPIDRTGNVTPTNSSEPNLKAEVGELASKRDGVLRNKEFYVKAVEVLINLAELVIALQERRLCVAICRPEVFAVRNSSSDEGDHDLVLHTLSYLKPISRYNHGLPVTTKVHEVNAQACQDEHERSQDNSYYQTHDTRAVHASMQGYSETNGIVRRMKNHKKDIFDEFTTQLHLNYIAPETISTSEFSWAAADCYTWATCAYALLIEGLADFRTPRDEPSDILRDIHLHSTKGLKPLLSKIDDCPMALSAIVEKCISLDPEDRYGDLRALLPDLKALLKAFRSGTDAMDFVVGHIDRVSRFCPVRSLLERDSQDQILRNQFAELEATGQTKSLCCYGESGTGKSKQMESWVSDRIKERSARKRDFLVAWAKMDQHQVRPLVGIVQVFESMLQAVFSDPHENVTVWKSLILDALPGLGSMFLTLLSPHWQNLLLGKAVIDIDAVDWETYLQRFQTWARNLFGLFANARRPLILVIDDWQWCEASERALWAELLEGSAGFEPLSYTFALITYRIEEKLPLDMSPLNNVTCMQSLPFDTQTVYNMLERSFHLRSLPSQKADRSFEVLCSFLYAATQGNPLFLKFLLTRIVRDEVVSFDFDSTQWRIDTAALSSYSTSGIEAFAKWTLSRLSLDVQQILQILSCLPAAGVPEDLLERLIGKPREFVSACIETAATYGILKCHELVAFAHDRHQAAARSLIPDEGKSRFLASVAHRLAEEGSEYIFVRADLLMEALQLEHTVSDAIGWTVDQMCNLFLPAAQKAIRSAAFDSASRYLRSADAVLPVESPDSWACYRSHCNNLCLLMVATSAGLRNAAFAAPAVDASYANALTPVEKITASTNAVRLHLIRFDMDSVYLEVDRVFSLFGLARTTSEYMADPSSILPLPLACPNTTEELTSMLDLNGEVTDNDPLHSEAIALSCFMVSAGPTIYTRLPSRAAPYFDLATAVQLKSRVALKHPATGYLLGVRSILFAGESKYGVAAALVDVGNSVPWRDTPWQGSSEIPFKAVEYLSSTSISSIDFRGTWNAAALSHSTDILVYISVVELGALGLSGRSIPFLTERGHASLAHLKNDLGPIRPFVACFVQLAYNLSDAEGRADDLWRLNGAGMLEADATEMHTHGNTLALSYYSVALLNAVLLGAPHLYRASLARACYTARDGWSGVLNHFLYLWAYSLYELDSDEDEPVLAETHSALAAFPHNVDFAALRSILFAMKSLKDLRLKKANWSTALTLVEAAMTASSGKSACHLATGWLCLSAARTFRRSASLSSRIWGCWAIEAAASFGKCGAMALMRLVNSEFADVFHLPDVVAPPEAPTIIASSFVRRQRPDLDSPSASASDMTSSSEARRPPTINDDSSSGGISQRLNMEGILKSFLAFATERDSKGLLSRVLSILIQISRADSGYLALQDATTGKLFLRGAGTDERVSMYNLPVTEAASVCPSSVLLHVAHSRKPVDSRDSDQTHFLRDISSNESAPKHVLCVPLFFRDKFTGAICLHGNLLRFADSVKSQVELLGTFAAMVLESHDVTASLEASVRLRTSQLEQALAHRAQFTSSITHELRTPLHSISGLTAIMENSSDLPAAQKENVAGIRSSAEDLQRIITDVLDLSKLENGSMQIETISFDLREVAEASLDSMAHLAHAKDLELLLTCTVDEDPPKLLGDPFRIKQCLLNLLGNAIRFTESGSIRLSWTVEPSPVGGLTVVLMVEDTGIGIPVESRQRLFQPFSQIDSTIQRKYGGTGLGLSITSNLARMMGGSAWCESVEGRGSKFYFSVLVQGTDQKAPVEPYHRATPLVVLVIAPPGSTTDVLVKNLSCMKVRTILSTPNQAGNYASQVSGVILDASYSERAMSFVQKLSTERPDIKVTYLAELTDRANLLTRIADPSARIITKPVKARALFEAIDDSGPSSGALAATKKARAVTLIDKETSTRFPLEILFVDDNPINRAVGLKILKKFGYTYVDTASNGLEAVSAAESKRYDLILMDLQMPLMDGHTARMKIAEREKDLNKQDTTFVVALTANADSATRQLCMEEQGFDGFLGKPLVIRELDAVFETAYMRRLDSRTPATPRTPGSPASREGEGEGGEVVV